MEEQKVEAARFVRSEIERLTQEKEKLERREAGFKALMSSLTGMLQFHFELKEAEEKGKAAEIHRELELFEKAAKELPSLCPSCHGAGHGTDSAGWVDDGCNLCGGSGVFEIRKRVATSPVAPEATP